MNRWERRQKQKKRWRAVAYMRRSTQGGQENSIDIQRETILSWTERNDVEIVAEYDDPGFSGLTADRPGFQALLSHVQQSNQGKEKDLDYVVCLDVSRWGRFQQTDKAGYYETLCADNGVDVVFVEDGDLRRHEYDGDDEDSSGEELMKTLGRPVKRYLAKEHSRVLSKKVLAGTKKVSWQGNRAGGPPPFGTLRMEVDSQRNEIGIMKPKQHKCNPNNRVKLTPDEEGNAEVVREIFNLFVSKKKTEKQVAAILNEQNTPAPMGGKWRATGIRHILQNEQYAGSVIYYKTRHKLGKKKTYRNPPQKWIRVPGSYKPVVEQEIFDASQEIFRLREKRMTREEVLVRLRFVFEKYGMLSYALLKQLPDMPCKREIVREFGSLPEAFHALYPDVIEKVRNDVRKMIEEEANDVKEFEDFLIINQLFSVKIVPALPFPRGYGFEWHFRIDKRIDVDITLGVPLHDCQGTKILGYFPRLGVLTSDPLDCIADSSSFKIGLYGYLDLRFISKIIHWTNSYKMETKHE